MLTLLMRCYVPAPEYQPLPWAPMTAAVVVALIWWHRRRTRCSPSA